MTSIVLQQTYRLINELVTCRRILGYVMYGHVENPCSSGKSLARMNLLWNIWYVDAFVDSEIKFFIQNLDDSAQEPQKVVWSEYVVTRIIVW